MLLIRRYSCVVAAAVRFYYGVKELNLSIEATGNVRYGTSPHPQRPLDF